jgi:uncharacterized membrane protein
MDKQRLTTSWLFGFAYGLVYAAIALAVVDVLPTDSRPNGRKAVHALMMLIGSVCLIVAVVRRRRESRAKP